MLTIRNEQNENSSFYCKLAPIIFILKQYYSVSKSVSLIISGHTSGLASRLVSHMSCILTHWQQTVYTICREIFAPVCFLQVSPSTADVLKTGQIPMFQTIFFIQNTVWANSIRGETVCEFKKGRK